MTQARRWGVLVVTCLCLTALAAGCSSTHSLAQDQQAVNSVQALVNKTEANVSIDQRNVGADTYLCVPFRAEGGTCPAPIAHHLKQNEAQLRKDEAKLKADELNLQVAEDQLKKDESGN